MRVLYVGAGCDTRPLAALSPTLLVCVDSQPFSEFGTRRCPGGAWGCTCTPTSTEHCYSRPFFLAALDDAMHKARAPLTHVQGNERRYGDRVVYRTNTALPDHVETLRAHGPFDTLVVAGHHPHASVLTLLSPESTFVGFHGTVYYSDGEQDDTVVHRCEQRGRDDAVFARFVYVTRSGARIRTDRWSDFVRSSLSDS